MDKETHPANQTGNGGYERSDIGVAPVLYFMLGLMVAGVFIYFLTDGIFSYLEKRSEAQQTPVSPLVTNAPKDTRQLSADYKDYLKQSFPAPQLEIDERGQLDKVLTDEEQTLSSYDWVDQKAGTIRIPIDRAMDLLAQRGLPVRAQAQGADQTAGNTVKAQPKKGTRK